MDRPVSYPSLTRVPSSSTAGTVSEDTQRLDSLCAVLREKRAVVAVVGLGFAGFPQAIEVAKSGFRVVGIDLDAEKVERISGGESLSPDVPNAELRRLQESGSFRCFTSYEAAEQADVVVVCVPTPLNGSREPDLRYVKAAADGLRRTIRAGQLVVLESTVPPGTTRNLLAPVLEEAGLKPGVDAFLAFAPERIDPGNQQFPLHKIPRLVGGLTPSCTRAASAFYELFVLEVAPVSSPEVAELSKNVENTFRFVNISFINEVAMLCDRMGVSVWEVLQAASTKPFAFMPHYPGPGVGGHCIPIVPFYLGWTAREHGVTAQVIDAAGKINDEMPRFVVSKLERELRRRGFRLEKARVLVVGVTYKPDVPDLRESAGLKILDAILRRGTQVSYYDPYVAELRLGDRTLHSEAGLIPADCAVVVTPHKLLDFDRLASGCTFIFDTVNALPRDFPADVVKL